MRSRPLSGSILPMKASLQSQLDLNQKIVLNRIIQEISDEKPSDIANALKKPHINRIFKEEFSMTDREIRDLEAVIVRNCEDLIENYVNKREFLPLKRGTGPLQVA